ncbi:metal-dependent hydrolase [Desulfofundulus thermocisternus]|uniref:metal-dependent hydrolase n=1 Tax=Desulfofundulus thermocisternus TaxID=42471 RepID=UPI00217E7D96|nr:metal-dependent hydrolase [Desulfofundulus thermocisternus]MCS5695850.1 metal-dependent hydrolase [Desulfofundulus thermocisternus]
MKVTFIGHAAFFLEGEARILIDPFITGNPVANVKAEDLHPDIILVTHGHDDHLGDAIEIAKRSGATIVSVFELASYCSRHGAKVHGMHIGGSYQFGPVKVKLTPAWHGSGLVKNETAEYLGTPCGFVFTLDGKTIYHAGDTGLFGDMAMVGRLHPIDLALLPIGDNFTMGPEDALEAVRLIKPNLVIPMHYNTWPLVEQDPQEFKRAVEAQTPAQVIILAPGETYEF